MKRSILLLSGLDHDFGHDFGHDLSRDLGAHGRDLVHSATPSIAMNAALPSAAVDAIPDATSSTPSTTMDAASSAPLTAADALRSRFRPPWTRRIAARPGGDLRRDDHGRRGRPALDLCRVHPSP